MRVLVTGSAGFTGGHLVRTLASRGYQVRGFQRHPTPPSELALAPGLEVITGDLRDRAALERAVSGVEVVYHVAAVYRQAGVPPDLYRSVNAVVPGRLVEAAAAAGVRRVVHCSTVGVHGDIDHPPANEDAPLKPGDVYQETKLEGERLILEAGARTGIEVTIVRPSGIYGPGDRRLLKLFRGIAHRRWVTLGRGKIYYHLTYIDDLVEGFRLCGEHAAAANRTYIIAGGEVTTLNDLVRLIAEVVEAPRPKVHLPVWPFWLAGAACEWVCVPLGVEPPIYRRRVDFFTKSRAFDITRARREIGYAPHVTLRDGVRRTIEWYRAHGWL